MPTLMFETPVEQWFDGPYAVIPERMRKSLVAYVTEGRHPGDFLTAVICNNLQGAVGRADDENLPLLPVYVRWFFNVPPGNCHGSPEAMNGWIARMADSVELQT